jgi:mono/diheme cytochrome c family protein
LESISDPGVTTPNTLAPEVLADEAAYQAAYGSGGDVSAGMTKYGQVCARCHAGGLNLGGATAPPSSSFAGNGAGYIAQKVRTSGPPPSGTSDPSDFTPGPMPFFEPDDLSEQDLKDIIAFITTPPT